MAFATFFWAEEITRPSFVQGIGKGTSLYFFLIKKLTAFVHFLKVIVHLQLL